jgi:hypothetical protein
LNVSHEEELEDSNVETLRRLLRSDALGANSSAELALSMTDCIALRRLWNKKMKFLTGQGIN